MSDVSDRSAVAIYGWGGRVFVARPQRVSAYPGEHVRVVLSSDAGDGTVDRSRRVASALLGTGEDRRRASTCRDDLNWYFNPMSDGFHGGLSLPFMEAALSDLAQAPGPVCIDVAVSQLSRG